MLGCRSVPKHAGRVFTQARSRAVVQRALRSCDRSRHRHLFVSIRGGTSGGTSGSLAGTVRTRPAPDGAVARRRACTTSERIASGERPLAARTRSARWLSRWKTCISASGQRRAPGLAALIAAERAGVPFSNEDFGDVAPVPVIEPRQQPAVGVGLQ